MIMNAFAPTAQMYCSFSHNVGINLAIAREGGFSMLIFTSIFGMYKYLYNYYPIIY